MEKVAKLVKAGVPVGMAWALCFRSMTPEEKSQIYLDECRTIYVNLPENTPERSEVLQIILDDPGYTFHALEQTMRLVKSESHVSLLVSRMKEIATTKDEWMLIWRAAKNKSDKRLARRKVLSELKGLEALQQHFLQYKSYEDVDNFLSEIKKSLKVFRTMFGYMRILVMPRKNSFILKSLKD